MSEITLYHSSHLAPGDDWGDPEHSFFEAYNWIVRSEHTHDQPPGVSRVLWRYGMSLNDLLDDATRQKLVRFLPGNGADRLAGTAADGRDETRGYIALDWLVRTYTPAWLSLAGLSSEAAALRDLRRIADMVAAQAAGPVVRDGATKAAAARAAAWAAAGDAPWAAPWAAAGDAAWAAAWDAPWAAAWAAARAAARAADGDAARAAARDAAGAAAGGAAWDAARAKLAPTVTQLQDSAIQLFGVLIAGEWA